LMIFGLLSTNTPFLLTVNRNGTVWLFICADLYLLSLGKMLMVSLVRAIAVDGHHIENDAVMRHTVDGRHRGHRTLEYSLPFAKDEIGRDQHRFGFIAFGQKGKEHLHFIAVMVE
jgi:hypothetical protein